MREDGRVATRNYHRRADHGELLGHRGEARRRRVRERRAGGLSQRRRRGRAGARHRLRHGDQGRGLRRPAAHSVGLPAPSELRRRHPDRPRLRGGADPLPAGGLRHQGDRHLPVHDHPEHRRHPRHHRGRREAREGHAAQGQPGEARDPLRRALVALPAVRRLGRLFRHHRQPGARRRGRPAGAPWRHRDPVRDAGDLRRRAPADPARGRPQDRREADRPHQVVGGLHQPQRRRDEQQSVPRQQGRRPHHHPREVARRRGQGRHHQPGRRLQICRADFGEGLRVHGFAGLRSGLRNRPGGERRQHHLLHHGPRLGLRLQAGAEHQARHQHRHVPEAVGGHGHRLRRGAEQGRAGSRDGPAHLRPHPARRVGRAVQERGTRLRRQRVHALGNRGDDVAMDLTLTLKDALPSDGTAGTLVGRAWVPGNPGGPSVVLAKADGLYDLTARYPTLSALLNEKNPTEAAHQAGKSGQADLRPGGSGRQLPIGSPRARQALPAGARRPAGAESLRRHLRALHAGARDRGARQGRPHGGERPPRRHQLRDRRRPRAREARLGRRREAEAGADPARDLVAVSRGRHRPLCRGLHQVAADVGRRHRRGHRHPPGIQLEQPRAGSRPGGQRRAEPSSERRSVTM